jgi:hypothetical protein
MQRARPERVGVDPALHAHHMDEFEGGLQRLAQTTRTVRLLNFKLPQLRHTNDQLLAGMQDLAARVRRIDQTCSVQDGDGCVAAERDHDRQRPDGSAWRGQAGRASGAAAGSRRRSGRLTRRLPGAIAGRARRGVKTV